MRPRIVFEVSAAKRQVTHLDPGNGNGPLYNDINAGVRLLPNFLIEVVRATIDLELTLAVRF